MKRWFLLEGIVALTFLIFATLAASWTMAHAKAAGVQRGTQAVSRLTPPTDGKPMGVAFVLTDGATVIDFAGPWEVFQDAGGPDGVDHFHLFTVGVSKNPVRTSGGMTVVPDYTFD